jgi:hypothetical protein
LLSAEGGPAPKAAYLLLQRPLSEMTDGLSLDDLSRVIGQVMVYARQTDRDARIEMMGVLENEMAAARGLIREVAGEAIDPQAEEKVIGRVSASRELLQNRRRLPDDATDEQIDSLNKEHLRDALLTRWPEIKLGVLDGRTPREVAGDPSCRVKLLAAIMLLEFWAEQVPGEFDFNELRKELGLPTLNPIDPEHAPVEELPLVRLHRVILEKTSDEALRSGFRRAVAFSADEAVEKFAQEVIRRPSFAGKDESLRAYRVLSQVAQTPEQALQYIMQGREAGRAAGKSCASWDLAELPLRLLRREVNELTLMINHIQSRHMEEPGVAESLMRFLVQIGAIRPDGTPAGPPQPAAAAGVAAEPAAEPGKLWTPDGEQSGGGGGSIWTPD